MLKERSDAEMIMVRVEERHATGKDILGRMNARIEELGGTSVWEDSDLEEDEERRRMKKRVRKRARKQKVRRKTERKVRRTRW